VRPLVAGRHRDAGGLPFGDRLGHVGDDEADVIDHRALGAAGRRRRARPLMQEHGDAGEADDLEVAGLDRGPAERYEQLLVGLHLLRV